jgi:hypothetical protein
MADVAPGGRWVDVAPERLAGWVQEFGERHGALKAEPGRMVVTFRAADGAEAELHPPFPPLPAEVSAADGDPGRLAELMAAHASAERTVGVVLVRLGGYAAGVFTGSPPRLVRSKTGSRLVHGRSAAGGTSQQRFARRREKQASEALSAAADTARAVLGPYQDQLDAVVLGGDRRAIASVREDARLRPLLARTADRFLTVPDPRLAVLRDTARQFRAIRVRLTEPAGQ